MPWRDGSEDSRRGFRCVDIHRGRRICGRRQIRPCTATADTASGGGRHAPLYGVQRSADPSDLPTLDRTRTTLTCRSLVREFGQFHGWTGLDDRCRGRPNYLRSGSSRWVGRTVPVNDCYCSGTRGSDCRICSLQPPCSKGFSRRRWQPSDRLIAWLASPGVGPSPAFNGCNSSTPLLPRRCNGDAGASIGQRRARLGGSSFTFLSASNRERIFGTPRGERGIRAQCRSCRIGGRVNLDRFGCDQNPPSCVRGLCCCLTTAPIFAKIVVAVSYFAARHRQVTLVE